jgi:NAD(P)-dependent dehydrogenase (short-subunit alcohol dehydrogenase family)
VLATGGADGITAEVIKRLAAESGCRVILCGRTDPGDGEEPLTIDWHDEATLRKGMIEHMRGRDSAISPAQIEQQVQRVLKQRRIRENLEAMRRAAAGVEYHVLDVRDTEALGELIDSLYERFGRIDGVLHGAGVVEDGWLRDKTADSFERVFQTKALSAHLLAKKLRPEALRFLVFFSSVSGRFGNAGQADYSAANEYLNKLAAHLDRSWPGRVVSINWGPWDAGMVSDGLRAAYASRGIELIDIDEGTNSLLAELRDPSGHAEVVLTRTPWQIADLDEAHA